MHSPCSQGFSFNNTIEKVETYQAYICYYPLAKNVETYKIAMKYW
jgi:chlorite dismutase